MDSGDLLTLGMGLYLAGGFVLHRVNLARLRKSGLELRVVSRRCPVPLPEGEGILARLDAADLARGRHDEGDVEQEAHRALAALNALGGAKQSASLAYLAAHIRLTYLANATNLELVAFTQLFALRRARKRFGETPALHVALAHAQTLLGQMTSAVDELGRAAFYAHGDRFYLDLVLESGFVASNRPELYRTCQQGQGAEADEE